MRPTELLKEIRKMRFEEAYGGWQSGRLTQGEAARLLRICERTFMRYLARFVAAGRHGIAIADRAHRIAGGDHLARIGSAQR